MCVCVCVYVYSRSRVISIPTIDSVIAYLGFGCVHYFGLVGSDCMLCCAMCRYLEGTNCSTGRGTTRPFEIVGAPFVTNVAAVFFFAYIELLQGTFAHAMNALRLPGATWRGAFVFVVFVLYVYRGCVAEVYFVPTFDRYVVSDGVHSPSCLCFRTSSTQARTSTSPIALFSTRFAQCCTGLQRYVYCVVVSSQRCADQEVAPAVFRVVAWHEAVDRYSVGH